jgi:histidyl-tRNA synthetase
MRATDKFMTQKFSLPRGTADILPHQVALWQDLEHKSRNILSRFGYREIRTPLFEETELFARSMGQTSDIVQKQMLNLKSQHDDSDAPNFALRPEGTAAIVRSYIQNDLDKKEAISKLFYVGPMFRGERPQKGRLRQFHQIGAEAIGPNTASPYLDAELIALAVTLLKDAGLPDNQFQLKLNTLGSTEDKENFSKYLREQLNPRLAELCPDCQNRFERNVFRILDCKVRECRAVVNSLKLNHSYLSEESRKYFGDVCAALDSLKIKYEVSFALVRGLDYYTHTVFEMSCPSLGSQDAVGAGGRYSGLVSQLGGPQVDAIGFAVGMERILLALGKETADVEALDAWLVSMDENALKQNFLLAKGIRDSGLSADMSYKLSSMKSQMRLADKMKARYVIILGEEELGKGVVTIKNMQNGNQEQISLKETEKIVAVLNT